MPLGRTRDLFSHQEWIYEVKWDGFRSLAHVDKGKCRLISRNGNQFKSFPALAERLPAELRAQSAVLDGEIVCLDRHGKTQFKDLLFRRGEPRFYAFDLLWCDADLRNLPLIDRKLRLRSVVPQRGERLLFYALTAGTLGCYAASVTFFAVRASNRGTALATSMTPKITSGMLDAGSVPQ
jgi:ATP-dependent DNA ligase